MEKKKADVFREFDLLNSTIQTIWGKTESKLLVLLNRKHREESANEVASMRRCTKPSSSTLFIKLRSSEDPMVFFFVISQLFDAVDYSNYVFLVSETIIQ